MCGDGCVLKLPKYVVYWKANVLLIIEGGLKNEQIERETRLRY